MAYQKDLFSHIPERYCLAYGTVTLYREFLNHQLAETLLQSIYQKCNWQSGSIHIAGKDIPIPRMNAWFAENGGSYTYSGLTLKAEKFFPELEDLRQLIHQKTNFSFNSCLANLYRNGNDSVAWHSDDEPELGRNPIIASVSLGAERTFVIRERADHSKKLSFKLPHGSLLLMEGALQHHCEHQVPKEPKVAEKRINLTFRQLL